MSKVKPFQDLSIEERMERVNDPDFLKASCEAQLGEFTAGDPDRLQLRMDELAEMQEQQAAVADPVKRAEIACQLAKNSRKELQKVNKEKLLPLVSETLPKLTVQYIDVMIEKLQSSDEAGSPEVRSAIEKLEKTKQKALSGLGSPNPVGVFIA